MAKKTKSKKSKFKKTKSESPGAQSDSPDEAKSSTEAVTPSWSTDDVYNLLKAVNERTLWRMEYEKLKGMEDKIDSLTQRVTAIDTRLKSIQTQDLHTISSNVSAVGHVQSNTVYPAITAIKAKTDRLP